MSDSLCVGVCMFDPETGVCMGCGRTPEAIADAPATAADGQANAASAAGTEGEEEGA